MLYNSTLCYVRLLTVLLILIGSGAKAQTPAWQTAVASINQDGNTRSFAYSVAADEQGNVYLAGSFDHSIRLGSTTLTSRGFSDVFVAKWSPTTGSFVWAQQAGGLGEDEAVAIAVNGTSVYVAGNFQSAAAYFGSTALTNTVGNNFNPDAFIAKLTDVGSAASFTWAEAVGGTGVEIVTTLAANGSTMYLAGTFSSTDATFGNTTLTTAGSLDGFVAQYADEGNTSSFSWVQQVSGSGLEGVDAVAVQGSNVYVAGHFTSGTVRLGSLTLPNNLSGYNDVFVAKLIDPTISTRSSLTAANPNFVWAQRAGGLSGDFVSALAVQDASIYIAGSFSSNTARFGNIALVNADLNGTNDMFVAKLTDAVTSASFTWAQRAGGIGNDSPQDLALRGSNVYVTGDFDSPTAGFGGTTLTNLNPAYSSYRNVFVTKLSDAGTSSSFVWAQQAGVSESDDRVHDLLLDGAKVYVTGYFSGTTTRFGALTLTGLFHTPVAYLASLSDGPVLASSASSQWQGIDLYPNPAHTLATLRVPRALLPQGAGHVQVLNALGQVLRTTALASASGEASLDVSGLAPGVYLLQIPTSAGLLGRRLVVD